MFNDLNNENQNQFQKEFGAPQQPTPIPQQPIQPEPTPIYNQSLIKKVLNLLKLIYSINYCQS